MAQNIYDLACNLTRICLLTLFVFLSNPVYSADTTEDETPHLKFVMELSVSIGKPINIGNTGKGIRTVVPITGGTFHGPLIRGTVMSGGADYQIYDPTSKRNNLEAIYCIMTDDGEHILVKNRGIASDNYFFTSPVFEADENGKYSWLNNGIYVCRPSGYGDNTIRLKVWRAEENTSKENRSHK